MRYLLPFKVLRITFRAYTFMAESRTYFISCVSNEFRSYRDDLRRELTASGCDIRIQEDFKVGGDTLLEKLDDHISYCQGVIHLIGDGAGAKPTPAEVRAILQRYSHLLMVLREIAHEILENSCSFTYTQWESYLAIFHGVKCYIYLADAESRREPNWLASHEDKASQSAHLARLRLLGRDRAILPFDDARSVAIYFPRGGS